MADSASRGPLRLVDLIIPVGAVAYALYYIASVSHFPFEARITGMMLGSILFVLCGAYFLRFFLESRRRGLEGGGAEVVGDRTVAGPRLIFVALIAASIFIAPWGGFTITTFLFLTFSFIAFGIGPLSRVLIVAAAAAIGGWLFFIVLLGTRFPPGPFEHLMGWIL